MGPKFPDQGSNSRPLRWQAGSETLDHRSPAHESLRSSAFSSISSYPDTLAGTLYLPPPQCFHTKKKKGYIHSLSSTSQGCHEAPIKNRCEDPYSTRKLTWWSHTHQPWLAFLLSALHRHQVLPAAGIFVQTVPSACDTWSWSLPLCPHHS